MYYLYCEHSSEQPDNHKGEYYSTHIGKKIEKYIQYIRWPAFLQSKLLELSSGSWMWILFGKKHIKTH